MFINRIHVYNMKNKTLTSYKMRLNFRIHFAVDAYGMDMST